MPRVPLTARVRAVAAGLLVLLALMALGGLAAQLSPGPLTGPLHLDREWTVPAVLSAGLLLLAAVLLAAAVRRTVQGRSRAVAAFLPVLLAVMALDELAALHEALERWTEVDWQLLYLPVVLPAGAAALVLLASWGTRSAPSALLVLGGAAWAVSQLLEKLQWTAEDERGEHYASMMLTEEVLEATGSALFVLTGLLVLEGALGRRAPTADAVER